MIRLPRPVLEAIEAAAAAAWPEEACGLLVGRRGADGGIDIRRVAVSPNVAEGDRRHRFEVSPQLRFDLMRELRGGPDHLVGHFHSHPGGPAEPSVHDRDRAWEPDLVWLVMPVADGVPGRPRGWAVDPAQPTGFRELPVVFPVAG